jgi:acyl-CoA synthetase (AMP-forming)/AMP-acid ligase II
MAQGLMQDRPLLVSTLIDHAAAWHPSVEIVSRRADGAIRRHGYADIWRRAKQLAAALAAIGVRPGDRIATLAWNDHRHLELYYAVSGIGAVLHTVNPRLDPAQIEFIIQHAEDAYVFFDVAFLPLIEALAPRLTAVKGFVALESREHLPATTLRTLIGYEDFVAEYGPHFDWPVFDETSACSLCYTSGTTGSPKGVLYSHRSTLLHSYAVCAADGFGLSASDTALVVVPLFHVNAWGIPYAAAMCGAKLVLPGPRLDGASLYELMRSERVTLALGVPTVWMNLFAYVEQHGLDPRKDLRLERVVIGGAPVPRTMIETFERRFGVEVLHAWGMTETSPLGTVCRLLPKHATCAPAERLAIQSKQGRPPFGIELRIVDEHGRPAPHDGATSGYLKVRGPWVASSYFKGVRADAVDAEGFFDTGDIATIDPDGYLHITDRAKDLIKSGGEWISSTALEEVAASHPAIAEAAAIAMPHPKWQERPLLIVVTRPGQSVESQALLTYVGERVPKWWVPDDVVFIEAMPRGATGKLLKSALRDRFRNHVPSR